MSAEPSLPARMPVLFVGHGSPLNAIEDNPFSRKWQEVGSSLPRPAAILCISAHWETWGTAVTTMEQPRTIHDFGGFPRELYQARYPAPGSPWLAGEVRRLIQTTAVESDFDWGLDHGCWSVLSRMFPPADIPVVQLSMDYTQPARVHYQVGKQLAALRRQGVLIVGSGNMVHNLRLVALKNNDFSSFNEPFGFEWTLEASRLLKDLIDQGRHTELIDYPALGRHVQLAVPTPEHYLPMLYALALKEDDESFTYFNDVPLAGALTMTSFVIH